MPQTGASAVSDSLYWQNTFEKLTRLLDHQRETASLSAKVIDFTAFQKGRELLTTAAEILKTDNDIPPQTLASVEVEKLSSIRQEILSLSRQIASETLSINEDLRSASESFWTGSTYLAEGTVVACVITEGILSGTWALGLLGGSAVVVSGGSVAGGATALNFLGLGSAGALGAGSLAFVTDGAKQGMEILSDQRSSFDTNQTASQMDYGMKHGFTVAATVGLAGPFTDLAGRWVLGSAPIVSWLQQGTIGALAGSGIAGSASLLSSTLEGKTLGETAERTATSMVLGGLMGGGFGLASHSSSVPVRVSSPETTSITSARSLLPVEQELVVIPIRGALSRTPLLTQKDGTEILPPPDPIPTVQVYAYGYGKVSFKITRPDGTVRYESWEPPPRPVAVKEGPTARELALEKLLNPERPQLPILWRPQWTPFVDTDIPPVAIRIPLAYNPTVINADAAPISSTGGPLRIIDPSLGKTPSVAFLPTADQTENPNSDVPLTLGFMGYTGGSVVGTNDDDPSILAAPSKSGGGEVFRPDLLVIDPVTHQIRYGEGADAVDVSRVLLNLRDVQAFLGRFGQRSTILDQFLTRAEPSMDRDQETIKLGPLTFFFYPEMIRTRLMIQLVTPYNPPGMYLPLTLRYSLDGELESFNGNSAQLPRDASPSFWSPSLLQWRIEEGYQVGPYRLPVVTHTRDGADLSSIVTSMGSPPDWPISTDSTNFSFLGRGPQNLWTHIAGLNRAILAGEPFVYTVSYLPELGWIQVKERQYSAPYSSEDQTLWRGTTLTFNMLGQELASILEVEEVEEAPFTSHIPASDESRYDNKSELRSRLTEKELRRGMEYLTAQPLGEGETETVLAAMDERLDMDIFDFLEKVREDKSGFFHGMNGYDLFYGEYSASIVYVSFYYSPDILGDVRDYVLGEANPQQMQRLFERFSVSSYDDYQARRNIEALSRRVAGNQGTGQPMDAEDPSFTLLLNLRVPPESSGGKPPPRSSDKTPKKEKPTERELGVFMEGGE